MALRKIEAQRDDKTALLRITIPKRLLDEIRKTKKLCREQGFVFDIRPDVAAAIERAIDEAKKAVSGKAL